MGKFELIELQNALEVVNNQVKKLEKNLKFYENISNQLATGMLDKNIKNLDDFLKYIKTLEEEAKCWNIIKNRLVHKSINNKIYYELLPFEYDSFTEEYYILKNMLNKMED